MTKALEQKWPIVTGCRWGWSRSSCNNADELETSARAIIVRGASPTIVGSHQRQMRTLLGRKPDLTLKELRVAVALECTLPAIHYVLKKMGLTYKKRRSGPASRTVRTLRGRAGPGGGGKPASTRPG